MTARLPGTTAEVTPAYGMRPVGGFGVRGFRVFCPACGLLGRVVTYGWARRAAHQHRCECVVAA